MSAATISNVDLDQVRMAVEILIEPDAVVELRAPINKGRVVSGYYENTPDGIEALLRDVRVWGSQQQPKNAPDSLYITLNRIDPLLLPRSPNTATDRAALTTSDDNVIRRRWLLTDCDAIRPAGVSSTDLQHTAALQMAARIGAFLRPYGIETIKADSGNGGHLLIPLDLPNTVPVKALLERVLKALAHQFDNEQVHVDLTTFNASRVSKLYGTTAGKGASTAKQPHRIARLLDVPDDLTPASVESLEQIAALLPTPARGKEASAKVNSAFDLQAWLDAFLPDAEGPEDYKGGERWTLPACPFNPAHTGKDAAVFRLASGAVGFRCLHSSCASKDWHALRELLDPRGRNGNGRFPESAPPHQDSDAPPVRASRSVQPPTPDSPESSAAPVASAEWEAPIELLEPELPAFPTEELPDWIAEYVMAVSVTTQTPPDVAALLALATLAIAVQKRVEAQPRPDWIEPLCIWIFVALASGNVKSGVHRLLVDPVSDYEYELAQSMRADIAADQQDREIKEARLKHLRDRAAKEKDVFRRQEAADEAAAIARELAAQPPLVAPRFLADDTTPEKVAMLLAEQSGRIAIMSPDTDAFAIMGGRYSGDGQANFTVYLKAHAGDDIRVDRVTRAPIIVRRPTLTMGLMAQPGVLVRLSEKREFRDRGLLARFFYSIPRSWVGSREIDPEPIPDSVRQEYHRHLRCLLAVPAAVGPDGRPCPHQLAFTPAALQAVSDFRRWLEPQLGEGGELEHLADWGAKLGGAVVRIAALLHLAEPDSDGAINRSWTTPVSALDVSHAVHIAEYLIAHARASFRLIGSDSSLDGARKVIRWLQRHEQPQVSKRDIHNALQGSFKTAEELDAPLSLLVDHHYLRLVEAERTGKRGRPGGPVFDVNPALEKK